MAQWSPARATIARQLHEAKVAEVEKLLRWNQWQVERVEPDAWKVTMPGSAWMIVRGFEALKRKTIGMR